MSQQGDYYTRNGIGAPVYYSITAGIIIFIAVFLLVGRWYFRRKAFREAMRRRDLEQAQEQENMTRRGEAPGLPGYYEPGTIVPVPTLSYPEPAHPPPGHTGPPALPGYDLHLAPPEYKRSNSSRQNEENQAREMQQVQTGDSVMRSTQEYERDQAAGQMHVVPLTDDSTAQRAERH